MLISYKGRYTDIHSVVRPKLPLEITVFGRYDVCRHVAVASDAWYPGKIKSSMAIVIRNFCLGLHSLKQAWRSCSILCRVEVVAEQKFHQESPLHL